MTDRELSHGQHIRLSQIREFEKRPADALCALLVCTDDQVKEVVAKYNAAREEGVFSSGMVLTPRQIAERDRDETQRQRAIEHGMIDDKVQLMRDHQNSIGNDIVVAVRHTAAALAICLTAVAVVICLWRA